jgi:tRNA(Ile)-lysidine synthase
MRGAGLRGLAGIDPRRADGIVRPLIDVDRASIERYVRKHDLAVVRDPSNDATRFRRVRIRSAILPTLVAESPKVIEHLADLADEARATVAMLDAQTPHLGEDVLRFSLLKDMPEPLLLATLRKLAMRVAKTPPSRAHLEALRNLVEKDGEVWLAGGVVVRRAEQGLVVDRSLQHSGHIERRKKRTPLSQIPEPGESQGSQD